MGKYQEPRDKVERQKQRIARSVGTGDPNATIFSAERAGMCNGAAGVNGSRIGAETDAVLRETSSYEEIGVAWERRMQT